ncbi:MAG TPA: flagellar basal body L-ring protein FlgH [Terriglobales bacterium]|nr:flagellar basal body L-ring protein FlgH [Terriglobales bacterium]
MTAFYRRALLVLMVGSLVGWGAAKTKTKNNKRPDLSSLSLQQYLQRVQGETPATTTAMGSLWPLEGGQFTDLASDYKARRLNDLVTISVVEQILAQASGNSTAQRTFNTTSGITGIAGRVNTGGVNSLFAANSANNLKGTGASNSQSLLQTNLSARVVAVLPNGNLVVEAERQVSFNQQTQTIILRGVVRPGDIGFNNTVPSTALSDVELELKGKGIVSDAVRQPNLFMRLLMKLVNF